MSRNFLDAVYQGKNFWWIYLSVILTLIVYWSWLGRLTIDVVQFLLNLFHGDPAINTFVAGHIPFAIIMVLLWVAVTKLHGRGFLSLVNVESSLQFQRLFWGFSIWGLQNLFFTCLDILAHPKDYQFTFEPSHWFLLLGLGVLFVPIQTSIEEFLYRGYLMQGLSLISRHPLLLIVGTSVAFAIPHLGNPEMQRGFVWGALSYFAWGVFFALITLKDQGLELALGAHAANNLFSFLGVNTPDSVLPTQALYTYLGTIQDRDSFFGVLTYGGIFYAIFFGGIPRHPKILPAQKNL
jgi:uncharacterized protein